MSSSEAILQASLPHTLKKTIELSSDGVMQAPGGPDEDTSGGFQYGGWIWAYSDATTQEAMAALFAAPFELLLGRKTYDIFAAYWPQAAPDHPIGAPFNRTRKYVASRNPNLRLGWQNSHALIVASEGEDAVAAGRRLKGEAGPDLLIQGSADFLHSLFAHGLVDELNLMTFPLLLGEGKRLFGAESLPGAWRLTSAKTSGNGVAINSYVRHGEIVTAAPPGSA